MKSGTFTNNTSFTATAAQVNVPTGTVSIEITGEFTVPTGITVIKVSHIDAGVAYVGVTPGTKHSLRLIWFESDPHNYHTYITCDSHNKRYLDAMVETGGDGEEPFPVFDVDWSPEINTYKPDVTDY